LKTEGKKDDKKIEAAMLCFFKGLLLQSAGLTEKKIKV